MSTCISRTIGITFISLFIVLAAGAQSKKNDISFSIGALPVPYIITDTPTTFNVSYMHALNNYVSIGGTAGYTHAELSGHDDCDYKTGHVISIMSSIRTYWFKATGCRFYSSATLGVQTQFRRKEFFLDYDNPFSSKPCVPISEIEHDTKSLPAFQLSPIGIELGGESVKAFAELGLGAQGLGQAGIRVRF